MKKISVIYLTLAMALLNAGCYKDPKDISYTATSTFNDPTKSLLKINYLSAYSLNPSVQLSINKVRVSGLIGGRTPFPGGGYNVNGSNFPDYLVVTPGSLVLDIAIPKRVTNTDSVLLFTTPLTLQAAKNYTVHITDTLAKTKMVLVEDDLSLPAANRVKYKFLNLMPNVPAIDLYYGTTLVATNIAYLASSPYFTMPASASGALAWTIRETGTSATSTALATFTNINTVINQRVYTAFALGYKGATAINTRPYISFVFNK